MYTTSVTVRESDKYSQNAYLKFARSYNPDDNTGCSEMFLSLTELENLADTLKQVAARIRSQQDARHSEAAI